MRPIFGLTIALWCVVPAVSAGSVSEAIYPANPAHLDTMVCVSGQRLACFDVDTDTPRWVSDGLQVLDYPVITDGLVLAGSSSGVRAYERKTGRLAWHHATNGRAFSPSVKGGTVFATTEAGQLFALDLADGRERWMQQFEGWIYAPAIVSGKLITGGQSAEVVALEASTGNILWRIQLPQELVYRLVPGEHDDVIATTFGTDIVSVSVIDGSIRWRHSDQVASFSPTLTAGRLFFVGLDQQLHARDASSGRVLWRNASRFAGSTVNAVGTRLFALDEAGQPIVLDVRNGLELAILSGPGGATAVSIASIPINRQVISFTSGGEVDAQSGTIAMPTLRRHVIHAAATYKK